MLDQVFAADSLDEVATACAALTPQDVRRALETEFRTLAPAYADAVQWNRLVRVCEALSIVGWGDLERVDARAADLMGSVLTVLTNRRREKRLLQAQWAKRKAGMFRHDSQDYYASPDFPERPIDIRYPDCDIWSGEQTPAPRLATQRNPQPTSPFGMFVIDWLNRRAGWEAVQVIRTLFATFDDELVVEGLGDGLRHIAVQACVTRRGEQARSRVAKKLFRQSAQTYYVDWELGDDLVDADDLGRRMLIASLLRETLDDLAMKVTKKRVDYDVAALRAQVEQILGSWLADEPTPSTPAQGA